MDKNTINFADFQKLDLRVAEIISAEIVEGKGKLVKLTLNVDDPSTLLRVNKREDRVDTIIF